jgi:hypothetical protein
VAFIRERRFSLSLFCIITVNIATQLRTLFKDVDA